MKNNFKSFHVIIFNFNTDNFEKYDIMPYLMDVYNNAKHRKEHPKTFEEFKQFVIDKSMYRYWARCEYEIIISDWPNKKTQRKIDIYYQIMMNIDNITEILMSNVL